VEAAVGEYGPVARIEVPARREFVGVEIGAVDGVGTVERIDDAVAVGVLELPLERAAVVLDPVDRLLPRCSPARRPVRSCSRTRPPAGIDTR